MPENVELKKLLVVVDPNDDQHVALDRALLAFEQTGIPKDQVELLVFVSVDSEAINTRANNDNLIREQEWFEEVIKKPIEDAGIAFQVSVSWSSEWQESIVQEAQRFGAHAIYLPLHPQTNKRRFTFSESKWALMKQAGCPVILIRPGAKEDRKVILAAVNFQALKPHQNELNRRILGRAKWVANNYKGELHIVNGYLDSMHYPDRGKLVNESGVDSSNVHVQQGYTDEVVAAVAKEIDADIVVMGTLGQTGKEKTRRGNTAERVIAGLDVDTVVVN